MATILDVIGGNAAKTDRRTQLTGYGLMENIFNILERYANQDRTAGAIDTGRATQFYSSLLSGDPSRVAAAVAPETNVARQTGEQEIKQLSQFGNRGGGTNAAAASVREKGRGGVLDAILRARTGAAGQLGVIGSNELSRAQGDIKGAGDIATSLTGIASDSRTVSQALHDEAIKKWNDLISGAEGAYAKAKGIGGA